MMYNILNQIKEVFELDYSSLALITRKTVSEIMDWWDGTVEPNKHDLKRLFIIMNIALTAKEQFPKITTDDMNRPLLANGETILSLLCEEKLESKKVLFAISRLNMLYLLESNTPLNDPFQNTNQEYFWTEDTFEACAARRLLYDGEYFNDNDKKWRVYQHTDQLGWDYRFPKNERNMDIMKPKLHDIVLYRFEKEEPFSVVGYIREIYDTKVQIAAHTREIWTYADVDDVDIENIQIIRRNNKHFPLLTIKRYKE